MEGIDDLWPRIALSVAVVLGGVVFAWIGDRSVSSRVEGTYERFYGRKFVRYGVVVAVAIALVVLWQPFGSGLAAALGLATAGIAFAMQEVIGALAGWFNITVGRIFTVGDRIQMAGVRGDVIDISPMRTKLMEIGSATDPDTWVKGRQHTGRMVAISNKASFTEPVFNFSSFFDFIWEELAVLIPHHEDVDTAAGILRDEAEQASDLDEALTEMRELRDRFPVPEAELLPRVFSRIEDDGTLLAARFVVPTRTARSVKDAMARNTERRLSSAGVEVVITDVVQRGPSWEPVRGT